MFEAGPGDLFRFGLTSNQAWILAALFGAPVMNWVERQTSDVIEQAGASGMLEAGAFAYAPIMLALLAGVFVLALAMVLMTLSGVVAVIRYHGFRLGIESDRIKGRFGLLDAREKTLRREKMHSLELAQTAVGRVLGQWHAIGRQTGAGQAGELVNQDRRFLVPGIDRERLDHVASGLIGMDWAMPAWGAIDARFRTMLWTRISVVLVFVAVLSWLELPGRPLWPACAILGFNVLVLLLVHLHWKRWGYALRGSRLSVRSGLVGQKIVEFELSRCQQVGVLTSPYQRRHGLATLKLRLPHGEQAIPYLPGDVAAGLANRLLLEAERAHSHAL
ncbi:MAG: PH domain-containing protein [Wenzhouxiangellaceae bacterium]|nr:PH domain-containing protein [Wenzhouxiangellaceae bacterium]